MRYCNERTTLHRVMFYLFHIILVKKENYFRRDERRKKITHETFPSNRRSAMSYPNFYFDVHILYPVS